MKKMITYLCSVALVTILSSIIAHSQTYLQIGFSNNAVIATASGPEGNKVLTFHDPALTQIFSGYTISTYNQSFPAAARLTSPAAILDTLLRVYDFTTTGSVQNLYSQVVAANSADIYKVFLVEHSIPLWEPNDYYDCFTRCVPNGDDRSSSVSNRNDLINAKQAWDYTRGLASVKVGIVDVGTTFGHHPDLDPKVTLGHGVSYATVLDPNYADHGTLVAGCVATVTDNGGIASLGNKVSLNYYNWDYGGIVEAVADGCKVVNCSWGWDIGSGPLPNPFQQMAIETAYQNGVTVVAAAGKVDNVYYFPGDYWVPASYDHVISVSSVGSRYPIGYGLGAGQNPCDAINWNDCHTYAFSNQCSLYNLSNKTEAHNDRVDICAPGNFVETTILGGGYTNQKGTSLSSPQVAAAAALLYSINPNISPDDVKYYLKSTAANIYNISQNAPFIGQLGTGRLDAGAALKAAADAGASCRPMFQDIIWRAVINKKSGAVGTIDNWDCWTNNTNNPTVHTVYFSLSTAPVSGFTVTWEFRYKDPGSGLWVTVQKTGINPSLTFGSYPSANVDIQYNLTTGNYLAMCSNILEVYVRQEDNPANPVCVSAYYKETSYNPVCDQIRSSAAPIANAQVEKLQENVADAPLQLYPSPAYDKVTVRIANSKLTGTAPYQVMDATGKVVSTGIMQNGSNNLYIGNLSKGIYIFKLGGKKGEELRKFIKM